jgi:phosphatidylserine decarboxylase
MRIAGCRLPLASEGLPFILPLAAAAVISLLLGWALATGVAAVLAVLTVVVACFFRDPERAIPQAPGAVVSPADGRVHEIETEQGRRRISVFLSVTDVHVNRAPYAGRVTEVTYQQGRFVPAYRAEASRENESNRVTISSPDGTIEVKQIAGVLARRIVCRAQSGDVLEKGQRYGLIRFGSRTDLFLPADCDVVVRVGDKVRGAETILAYLKVRRDE